ncbi:E3 ubiquitin-protein ligase RNF4-like [Contarinia nasturtii]|uniref:E3 ubiquitin-protein ligase RNF4-like n=1 Tax=Contarinia nasturtii TaxID=265458 RepID=UPI0012D4813E|nr:E3 ubiquitin-protein ligase RNF4-like [Contarinia nasturtii]
MNTRKRNRKMNVTEIASTQQIESKICRTNETTHTDALDTDNSNEDKIDTSVEIMNVDENDLATGSAEQVNDDAMVNSPELEQNSNSGDQLCQEENTNRDEETDRLQREVDILLAAISESQRPRNANIHDSVSENVNDSDATIIIDTIDFEHRYAASATAQREATEVASNIAPTASTSAQAAANELQASANNNVDDSVVLIDDTSPRTVRPTANDDEEDVIFVTESRGSQRFRTIATIDLCDTPDTSYTRPPDANQLNEPETSSSSSSNNQSNAVAAVADAPAAPSHKTKCPICLETYGFDEILSTMCGHLYCGPCIRNVIKTRKKCPMCNRALKQNQVHRLFFEP